MNTPSDMSNRTVIIGGGVTGLCAAWYLARRGREVIVLDRDPVGEGASGGNAGILAAGHLPLALPGLAMKALGWMFTKDSPLYIPPRFDLPMFRWFWNFNRACNQATLQRSMETLAPLGVLAMEEWSTLIDEVGADCDFRTNGWMNVYRTDRGRRESEEEGKVMVKMGFGVESYDGPTIREREPIMNGEVRGAVSFTDSASLDPVAFMKGLATRLAAMGVVIRTGVEVEELIMEGGRCLGARSKQGENFRGAQTLLAAGIWSSGLAEAADLKLPMQGGKGYHQDLEGLGSQLSAPCVLIERFIAVTPMGDCLRLAGTVEFSGLNRDVVLERVDMLTRGASWYLAGVKKAEKLGQGCDLRPCTADGLPVLGWAPGVEGLMISTGGAKMGVTLAPALGKTAAELMLEGRSSLDVSNLRADRF